MPSRAIAVRSAAPASMSPPETAGSARAPSPSGSRSSTSRNMGYFPSGDAGTRLEEEAQRRAEDLRRKEREVAAMHSLDAHSGDPLAHLKEQFAELMDDLHGSKNDPDMAAVITSDISLICRPGEEAGGGG